MPDNPYPFDSQGVQNAQEAITGDLRSLWYAGANEDQIAAVYAEAYRNLFDVEPPNQDEPQSNTASPPESPDEVDAPVEETADEAPAPDAEPDAEVEQPAPSESDAEALPAE
jgi:hypothetical protein